MTSYKIKCSPVLLLCMNICISSLSGILNPCPCHDAFLYSRLNCSCLHYVIHSQTYASCVLMVSYVCSNVVWEHICMFAHRKGSQRSKVSFIPHVLSTLVFFSSEGLSLICNSHFRLGWLSSGCLPQIYQ